MQSLKYWQRFDSNGLPIYINPRKPDWFVAGDKADILLQNARHLLSPEAGPVPLGHDPGAAVFARELLFSRIEDSEAIPYSGRGNHLQLAALKECWFHLTNQCNLSCRHCLFSASPAQSQSLSRQQLDQAMAEAASLGCTLFYFTGGEPFVYPHFVEMMHGLLQNQQMRAVVLTNGLLLKENSHLLRQLPADRFHLQISLDGMEKNHDGLRGKGAFARLLDNLAALRDIGMKATLSVAVNRENIADLPAIIDFAADNGLSNIHLLWHFVRGKGSDEQFIPPAEIWPHLRRVLESAPGKGVVIDNAETIKSQVFSTPGTRYDLSNSGWESLAVGPDGHVYPSPALVGLAALKCGSLADGLEHTWRHGPVLQEVRGATLSGSSYEENALHFLIGGGDIDHSYIASGKFAGHDPYVELYNKMALWLIARQAGQYPLADDGAGFLLRMGDVRYDCPEGGQEVMLTHCNCVVSLSGDQGQATVREFYGRAAIRTNEEIVNPFALQQQEARFIPTVSKQRSYGCGSPVQDAELKAGETLVDLGSGSGVECFQAAKMVGPAGRVFGIDMTDEMLDLARASQRQVARELGYDNVKFQKGFLEAIPLADRTADAVISNCVINLSPDKRRTLHEAFRVLKPGGRLVVADIVTDVQVPAHIKNNEKFRGECLGGAMRQEDLMAMLRAAGFSAIKLIKRFPYRQIGVISFYSLTFAAFKPAQAQEVDVIYRGPFAAVHTESGTLLLKGKKTRITLAAAQALDDSLFVVNESGEVTNIKQTGGCCGLPPASSDAPGPSCCPTATEQSRQHADCLVCGDELCYFTNARERVCHYCGEKKATNASCRSGHFVCDSCHQDQGVAVIKKICTESAIEDLLTLMKKIRAQPAIAMHGPEHHALVPGVILSTYRARGGKVGRKEILTAIERGSKVPGGVCGFWGSCGAAIGAGIAFSVILEATPLTPGKRQTAQQVTAKILEQLSLLQAGRCCQRETFITLRAAGKLSEEILPVPLLAADTIACGQYTRNRECIRQACTLWETRDRNMALQQPLALVI
ncbi:MAG: methyltransferase domain-containing protein [Deltaproteobacteria bacterium]|nr:methyltransferase domain-containing protein [Deltaproteobacteria bacterium]